MVNLESESIVKVLNKHLIEFWPNSKDLNIVHGDFKANNILAKESETAGVLEDFKLVDFETHFLAV